MDTNVGDTERAARFVLAAGLTLAALRSLRSGKRARGLLIGAGALILGFTSTTRHCPVNAAVGRDSSGERQASIDIDDGSADGADAPTVDIDSEGSAEPGIDEPTAKRNGAPSARATLSCSACGDPIVPGQSRGPNEADEIVHESCQ